MNESSVRQNPLLIELLIVILFFALSSCLLTQLFFVAHQEKTASAVDSEAVLLSEDLIERFYASGQSADAFFTAEGWEHGGDGYTKTFPMCGRDVAFVALPETTEYASGAVEGFTLRVTERERTVTQLNAAFFRAAGGAQ